MKKLFLTTAMIFSVGSLIFFSCKKDKNNNPTPSDPNTMTDSRDGKTYKTLTIGGQTWMAANLNYSGTLSAGSSTTPSNSEDSANKYGRYYNFAAAQVACPSGWHLPSDVEWRLLEHNLGMTDADTAKLGLGIKRGYDQGLGIKMQKGGSTGFDIVLGSSFTGASFYTPTPGPTSGDYYARGFVRNDSTLYRYQTPPGIVQNCVRCLKNQ
jgi:uncharacterized protein (TIGR02145 family)